MRKSLHCYKVQELGILSKEENVDKSRGMGIVIGPFIFPLSCISTNRF